MDSSKILSQDFISPSELKLRNRSIRTFPRNVLTNGDVELLDLSQNPLRRVPADIKRLSHLTSLNLSESGIRCNHPQDFTSLPRELGDLLTLRSLNLSRCNLGYVPPAVWTCRGSLERLDLSGNKLNVLPPELGALTTLLHLIVKYCSLSTLPKEIAYCLDLEVIDLRGNVMETLPDSLKYLQRLSTLHLNCQSFSSVIDTYTEKFLRSGEMKSEHIPYVLFEITGLQNLDMSRTKINNLPEFKSETMRRLDVADNFFTSFPASIFKLHNLRKLDISGNSLERIPAEISELQSLEELNAARNRLTTVAQELCGLVSLRVLNLQRNLITNVCDDIVNLKNLKVLNLSHNRIVVLPNFIFNLKFLTTLNVSCNRIDKLPRNLFQMEGLFEAHGYRNMTRTGLWLQGNPLSSVPASIWKNTDIEVLFRYLKEMRATSSVGEIVERDMNLEELENKKCTLILLGDKGIGKSYLSKSLKSSCNRVKRARDREEAEAVKLVDSFIWKTSDNTKVKVYDFHSDALTAPSLSCACAKLLSRDQAYVCVLVGDSGSLKETSDNVVLKKPLKKMLDIITGTIDCISVKVCLYASEQKAVSHVKLRVDTPNEDGPDIGIPENKPWSTSDLVEKDKKENILITSNFVTSEPRDQVLKPTKRGLQVKAFKGLIKSDEVVKGFWRLDTPDRWKDFIQELESVVQCEVHRDKRYDTPSSETSRRTYHGRVPDSRTSGIDEWNGQELGTATNILHEAKKQNDDKMLRENSNRVLDEHKIFEEGNTLKGNNNVLGDIEIKETKGIESKKSQIFPENTNPPRRRSGLSTVTMQPIILHNISSQTTLSADVIKTSAQENDLITQSRLADDNINLVSGVNDIIKMMTTKDEKQNSDALLKAIRKQRGYFVTEEQMAGLAAESGKQLEREQLRQLLLAQKMFIIQNSNTQQNHFIAFHVPQRIISAINLIFSFYTSVTTGTFQSTTTYPPSNAASPRCSGQDSQQPPSSREYSLLFRAFGLDEDTATSSLLDLTEKGLLRRELAACLAFRAATSIRGVSDDPADHNTVQHLVNALKLLGISHQPLDNISLRGN